MGEKVARATRVNIIGELDTNRDFLRHTLCKSFLSLVEE